MLAHIFSLSLSSWLSVSEASLVNIVPRQPELQRKSLSQGKKKKSSSSSRVCHWVSDCRRASLSCIGPPTQHSCPSRSRDIQFFGHLLLPLLLVEMVLVSLGGPVGVEWHHAFSIIWFPWRSQLLIPYANVFLPLTYLKSCLILLIIELIRTLRKVGSRKKWFHTNHFSLQI